MRLHYRGHDYDKAPLNLNASERVETGKYRGRVVYYRDIEAVVPHPNARLKYRGVDF